MNLDLWGKETTISSHINLSQEPCVDDPCGVFLNSWVRNSFPSLKVVIGMDGSREQALFRWETWIAGQEGDKHCNKLNIG